LNGFAKTNVKRYVESVVVQEERRKFRTQEVLIQMNRKYDFGIVIGRFQPFHTAHLSLIQHSLKLAEKVIIILGSARSASDVKNPFTPAMREEIIRACFPEDENRLIFRAVRDYPYNDHVWTTEVQNIVNETVETDDASISIVGFSKIKALIT